MNHAPTTGFPENPNKKNKEEQLRILVERHNFLVDQVTQLEKDFNKKEERLKEIKKIIQTDLQYQSEELDETKEILRNINKLKKDISGNFKDIVKKTAFEKIKRRVSDLKYEEYIYRDELKRLIDKREK